MIAKIRRQVEVRTEIALFSRRFVRSTLFKKLNPRFWESAILAGLEYTFDKLKWLIRRKDAPGLKSRKLLQMDEPV